MIGSLLPLILLILLFAFCSASAAAFAALADARVHPPAGSDERRGAAPQALLGQPRRTQLTLQIAQLGAAVGATALAGAALPAALRGRGAALAAGLAVFGLLLALHGLAHRLVAGREAAWAQTSAPAARLLSLLLLPAVWPLEWLAGPGPEAGLGGGHARRASERSINLDERCAWDVMTPRVQVFAWPAELRLAELAPQLREVRFSRVPVFERSIDQIVGVLYLRDAYQALIAGQRDVQLRELAREPFFVPGSIPLARLLTDFQTRRMHLGIVMDEYGGTDGVVTLEDVLEELVGEIADETDPEEQPIVRLSRSEIVVEGRADLREINHFFNTSFPQLEHRSLNGYLLDELGYVPKPGEELEREGVLIRVLQASDTQVLRAALVRPAPAAEPAAPVESRQA